MTNRYETPFGTYELNRSGDETNRTLQAWSSADLYLLSRLEEISPPEGRRILVLNDAFGALSLPLARHYRVFSFSDSYCAEKLCRENMKANGMDEGDIAFISPDDPIPGDMDIILLRIPKSLNFLEFELQLVARSVREGTPLIAADMAREIHSSTMSLFEHYFENVSSSLAWRKARLVTGSAGGDKVPLNSYPARYTPDELDLTLVNYPNLFAFGRLDPGTAFMLSRFPRPGKEPERIIDLACGDGILALKAASLWPEASILCTDESHLAIRSARESFELNGYTGRGEFAVADILDGVRKGEADMILCNPPFHDSRSLSTSTALMMFRQSREALKKGGELFVIANRHLGYEKVLNRFFSSVTVLAVNRKFSLIRAVR